MPAINIILVALVTLVTFSCNTNKEDVKTQPYDFMFFLQKEHLELHKKYIKEKKESETENHLELPPLKNNVI